METKNFNIVKEARKAAVKQLEFYNRMMATKTVNESEQYIREQVAFYDVFDKPKEKKLFIVDTISTFRHRYVIEANELEHAFDEVTMIDSGNDADSFESIEQEYMGETILDGREISNKDFKKLLEQMEAKGTGSHWMGEKLIRKIDYTK